jgi:glycine/D-amino acid oxidase-like deaminating enzyme
LVVGGGALGLFTADALARRSVGSVACIAPSAGHGAASLAAGAMLGCFGEVSHDTLVSEVGRTKFELGHAAHRRWPEVLERLGATARERGEQLTSIPGTHVILNARGGELDSLNFAAMLGALDRYGEPWSEADPRDIPGYRPRTDSRALRAVYLPGEGAVNGRQVLALMEAEAARAGVRFIRESVDTLNAEGGRIRGVRLDDGTSVAADVVVLCAGAHSGRLLETVLERGAIMPTFAGAGHSFVGRRTQGEGFESVIRSPNRSGACGLHLIPLGDGLEYIGATNLLHDRPQLEPNVGMAHFVAECAMQQLDERVCFHTVAEWRTGNRPVTLDGFPLVGWSGLDGLYVLTGTYRDGFHCAPVLAEHAADEIEGKEPRRRLPFQPTRRPIRVRTVRQSVDEAVRHMAAGWFEAGASAPPEISTAALERMLQSQAEAVYEAVGGDYGFGPDVMIYLNGPLGGAARLLNLKRYLRAVAC